MDILFTYGLVNSLTLNIVWLIILLCHKIYKDSIINRQRQQIRTLEEAWTRKKHELHRKKIKSSTDKSVRNVKIKVDNKKFNALRWKDQKIWNFWEKIEDIGNDRKLKSTSIRDIAWG